MTALAANNAHPLPPNKDAPQIAIRPFLFRSSSSQAKSRKSPRGKPAYTFMLPQLMDAHVSSTLNEVQRHLNALRGEKLGLLNSLLKLESQGIAAGRVRVAKMKDESWTAQDHEALRAAVQERRILCQALANRGLEVEQEIEYVRSVRWRLVERSVKGEEVDENRLEDIEEEEDDETLVGSERNSGVMADFSATDNGLELSKLDKLQDELDLVSV